MHKDIFSNGSQYKSNLMSRRLKESELELITIHGIKYPTVCE